MPILSYPFPTYQPAMRIIESITNNSPCTVTTTFAHQYHTGLIVRINIPLGFGMQQLNQRYGTIAVTGDTTFNMDIDTKTFDAFSPAATYPDSYQSATVTPIGEDNNIITQATQNVLPYSAT